MEDQPQIAWQGKWIVAKTQGKWEFVARARGIRAVVILAIDDEGHVLLVEDAGDTIEGAARRELIEETGYDCTSIEELGFFHSSPGMVSEGFTLVRARGLTRVGEGGGIGDEGITVHRVPLADIAAFVARKRDEGFAMDVKLLMLMAQSLLD
jgi:ADP-ribose pyrophosphatase